VEDQVGRLKALVSALPSSVPSATEDGRIASVFTNIHSFEQSGSSILFHRTSKDLKKLPQKS
jgi:hypothetical protein